MYLVKELTDASLPEIGRAFGGKHHTTVIHSINKIEQVASDRSGFEQATPQPNGLITMNLLMFSTMAVASGPEEICAKSGCSAGFCDSFQHRFPQLASEQKVVEFSII